MENNVFTEICKKEKPYRSPRPIRFVLHNQHDIFKRSQIEQMEQMLML